MQFAAAASSSLRGLLAGPAQPARLLGAGPAALYLETARDRGPTPPARARHEPAVVAVLAHDAVRLPCGIVLPTTRAELPLSSVTPTADSRCLIGAGQVSWTGPAGPVVLNIVREWPVVRIGTGAPVPAAVRAARAALRGRTGDLPAGPAAVTSLAIAAGLLGRGPGLTPAGDDLLAGLLLGALAFGGPAGSVRAAVAALGPAQTTALSAALLRHAARGECIGEAAALAAALAGGGPVESAVSRLLGVGHSSGAALALGLVLAAQSAAPG
jgi:Protein of unknown function (DUF2877)